MDETLRAADPRSTTQNPELAHDNGAPQFIRYVGGFPKDWSLADSLNSAQLMVRVYSGRRQRSCWPAAKKQFVKQATIVTHILAQLLGEREKTKKVRFCSRTKSCKLSRLLLKHTYSTAKMLDLPTQVRHRIRDSIDSGDLVSNSLIPVKFRSTLIAVPGMA